MYVCFIENVKDRNTGEKKKKKRGICVAEKSSIPLLVKA